MQTNSVHVVGQRGRNEDAVAVFKKRNNKHPVTAAG